ncbi:hypothetical protein [Effusibacillus consociatus]|uniref:Spore coat protein n=1 Tax=Effusibacillus consociatus TaxID=1117041 RepID=A0ABV9Q074_9BACL
MKFNHFVKLGGHTFNLLQNKDLLELFGMAKKGVQYYKEQQKNQPNQPAVVPIYVPPQYPIPIDSPYLHHAPRPPYGVFPTPNVPYGGAIRPGYPPSFPPRPGRGTLASARKQSRSKK